MAASQQGVERGRTRSSSGVSITVRIAVAIVGGYVLAALSSVAMLLFPSDPIQSALAGTECSFAVYAATILWAFGARSASRALGGWVVAVCPLILATCFMWVGG